MKSNPDYKQLDFLYLESLPEPVKTHFQQLCLLAFMSFTKLTVHVTFTDSEAVLYECFDFLGLMQRLDLRVEAFALWRNEIEDIGWHVPNHPSHANREREWDRPFDRFAGIIYCAACHVFPPLFR